MRCQIANGINPRGDVVGIYVLGMFRGYLLRQGVFTPIDIAGASFTEPFRINAQGDIAGDYGSNTGRRAFVLQQGQLTTFDFPGASSTTVFGINARGDVVGDYSDGQTHGFLLRRGVFTTIDAPGATSTTARDISDRGHIVGDYIDGAGRLHGFLAK